ncbi:pilin [Patescibacteria group bacterium]|nr:pilin [Patescibacteria group bacterium]
MKSKQLINAIALAFFILSFSFLSFVPVMAECGTTIGTLERIEICDVGKSGGEITKANQARGGVKTCADIGDTDATTSTMKLKCKADCTIDSSMCTGGFNIGVAPDSAPEDFDDAILNLTNWILGFAASIAVLALIWGGVQYMTSAGDTSKAENGKKTVSAGLIGLVLAGIAFAIVKVVVEVILT